MDFFQICTREAKGGVIEVYPDFTVGRSKDLMVRGHAFQAIWDEEKGLWSTDQYDVQRLVDAELAKFAEEQKRNGVSCNVKFLRSFRSNEWKQFVTFLKHVSDNSHNLDESLTFANTEVKKNDYVSRRLPYPLAPGDHSAWDELVGTLYTPEQRAKIEWAIGSIVSGDSKKLQKFLVFYGPGGTGKSTVLNIIQKLFEGYVVMFDAKALVGNNNSFSTEAFKSNPLVAIQHDGDLSKIEDNSKLNSIISHEDMVVNEKYKPSYTTRIHAFLFMGTNKPVKITDAKSGIIRRLIDVHPTGDKFSPNHYNTLMAKIDFELGAIAQHCLDVYREMGKNYYNTYQPLEMMLQTDVFFNFIEWNYDIFKKQDGATLTQAYAMYKEYCDEAGVDWVLPRHKFRDELRNYFEEFKDRVTIDGSVLRSYYAGFKAQAFKAPAQEEDKTFSLVMDETTSLLDEYLRGCPAQYAKEDGTPQRRWDKVFTSLADMDTSQLHYVRPPINHIVIDFDLTDENGNKSLERNLAAASLWPPTYAERSKSGEAVHLHYDYDGDVRDLARSYDEGIEIKVFTGGASLRRRLSRCNNVPVATISSGLPFKEKKVLSVDTVKSEKGLRDLIIRNLNKEIHPGTKPSIDFIKKILDDAYESGMQYDVSDLRSPIMAFANNSTHQPLVCLKTVMKMRFQGQDGPGEPLFQKLEEEVKDQASLVFYDVEVYPNLFVVCWMYEDDDDVVRMINPSPQDIEMLMKLKLVGFNNRRYDNHILYARYLGYDNEQLFQLSQKIIAGKKGAMFGEAYNLSWADIYDFSSKKQSLKKFELDLGIHHVELPLAWDKPVPPEMVDTVVDYCVNDVRATKATFKDREDDYKARQILAELSGLPINSPTAKHTARIIFGEDKNPQQEFVYTKLAKDFPGYVYEKGVSTYRGEIVGEGGYVYAEPGIHEDVALLDVASMHPTSIVQLNLFGVYTPRFAELLEARLAIKNRQFDVARTLLGGKLAKFLDGDEARTKGLAYALKIVINIVYGLTSAKFDNEFRDVRNVDNIVAKRGALFMIDLKHAIQEQGFTVAHIKTDSVKIPNATPEIIEFVKQFGEKYGYTFEHEETYDKLCLVNDAVYIARKDECLTPEWTVVDESADEAAYRSNVEGRCDDRVTHWTAVGAQFQHPYVFKTLFSKADIEFDDLCEIKTVQQGHMYLDFNTLDKTAKHPDGEMHFIGKTGRFIPVREGSGGGVLYRVKDDKPYAVTGTKGYYWIEAEMASAMEDVEIDMTYFETLAREAMETIDYFGSFHDFVS